MILLSGFARQLGRRSNSVTRSVIETRYKDFKNHLIYEFVESDGRKKFKKISLKPE